MSVRLFAILMIHAYSPKRFRISKYFSHNTIERCLSFLKPNFAVMSLGVNSKSPNKCAKERYPLLAIKTGSIIYHTSETVQYITGCKLLLFIQKKSHTRFRLVPKLVTLNNLDRRNGRYFTLDHRFL